MASYTRQSTFSDGDLITAALFNDEYNQLLAAFENTTGHKHDGTVGEGPVIGILGDAGVVTPLNKILIDTTNDHIEFWIDVSGTSTQQLYIADGAIVPVTDNDIDLGTSSLQFKDLYINGTANIDSLVADTADINGGTIDGTIIGGTSAAAITGTTITGTTITGTSFVIGSASIDETELEILDGATLTTTELNYVDGVTSSIQTQIDTKAPLVSPSLTGIPTAPTAASNTNTTQIATTAYVQSELTDLIDGAPGTLDTLNELAAAINDDANYNTTLTTALATKLPLAGGTMTGDVTYSDNVKAQFGTSNDLQIYHDGNHSRIVESGSGDMIIQGDEFSLMNVAGDEYMIFADNNSFVKLYYDGSNKLSTTSTGVDVTGTITADALTVDDITINGSTISDGGSITIDTEGDFIVDSEGDVYLDAAGNDWNLNSAGTNVLKVTNTSGDISIKSMTSDKDLIFKGVDGGSTITALTLDMSDAGKALFNAGANFGSGIDVTGTVVADSAGIGTSSPTPFLANSKVLEISDDSGIGSELILTNNSAMSADEIVGSLIFKNTDASGTPNHFAGLRARAESTFGRMDLEFYAGRSRMEGGTPDMVITPSGADAQAKVGIGTTSPSTTLSIQSSGANGIDLKADSSTTTNSNRLFFSTSAGTNSIMGVSGALTFRTGATAGSASGTERMRLDSSGNLLVGKTAASIATTGVELRPNGQLFATQSANYPLLLNRTTSDGDIIQLRKDNTTVGSINTVSGDLAILSSSSGHKGLRFGSGAITPTTNTGGLDNGNTDLGGNTVRFNNLYLAGTANFGSLSDGTITITGFADEDDMSSNSATLVPTQQSVKAYVDSQVSSAGGSGISFADDEKATFGDGLDLEIFHTGSSSIIKDSGTGSLSVRGTHLNLADSGGNIFIEMTDTGVGGTVEIKHNAATKLATTSTGIDVTGTVVADGLTVDGQSSLNNIVTLTATNPRLRFIESDTTDVNTDMRNSAGDFQIGTINDAIDSVTPRFNIDHATGDISFYEDTGTTAKLFWDASTESLGIGTSSPATAVEVRTSSDTELAVIKTGSVAAKLGAFSSGESRITSAGGNSFLTIFTNGSETARFDSSQNFMVGKTTAGVSTTGVELRNYGQILATRSGNYPLLLNRTTSDGDIIQLRKDGTTVGVIGSQNWGIGTTSPVSKLSIENTGSSTVDAITLDWEHLSTTTNIEQRIQWRFGDDATADTFLNAGYIGSGKQGSWQSGAERDSYLSFGTTNDNTQTEKMRISADGLVGIGTDSPTVPLTVNNQTDHSDIAIFHAGGGTPNRGLKISTFSNVNANAGVELDAQTSTGAFKFSTGGTERMRLTSTGLGIGTSSPDFTLDVEADKDTWLSRIYNTGSDANAQALLVRSDATAAHDALVMGVYADSGYKMVVRSSGNVGIGTNSPASNLHIKTSVDNSFSQGLVVERSANSDRGYINYNGGGFQFRSTVGDPIAFGDTSNEYVRIANGNVGIGTSSPSQPLHVEGNVRLADAASIQFGSSFYQTITGTSGSNDLLYRTYANHIFKTTTGPSDNTDGTERMRLNSTGLGIGATPSYLLDVRSSTSPVVNIQGADGNSKNIYFRKNTGDTVEGRIKVYADIMSFETGGSEAGRFDASGNFYVGTTNTTLYSATSGGGIYAVPNGSTTIARQSTSSTQPLFILNETGVDGTLQEFRKDGAIVGSIGVSSSDLVLTSSVADKDILFKGTDGSSAITALTLDMSDAGAAIFNGNVTAFSDERLKENIETLQGSKVLEMRGVSYVKDGKNGSGVIAQEIEKVAPELVHTAKDEIGTKSVAYGNLVGYLIEAIKDQQKQINDLKERLDNGTS